MHLSRIRRTIPTFSVAFATDETQNVKVRTPEPANRQPNPTRLNRVSIPKRMKKLDRHQSLHELKESSHTSYANLQVTNHNRHREQILQCALLDQTDSKPFSSELRFCQLHEQPNHTCSISDTEGCRMNDTLI